MASVGHWTGREARALRGAVRLSVRAFAEHLGVAPRTVAKWEALSAGISPRPDSQAILDTALHRADAETRLRFEIILAEGDNSPIRQHVGHGPREWDYETWTDDLGRASACLARQDFAFAGSLLNRWLRRFDSEKLDDHGLCLHARSIVLLSDLQRDQGAVSGPLSARRGYRTAHRIFGQLRRIRRSAQVELSLAVLDEMDGRLEDAASQYAALADEERLSIRDRTRAQSWVGTALSKKGVNDHAIGVLTAATHRFEAIEEPEDWSVTHQKLALACRGNGDLDSAQRYIDVALCHTPVGSPMQRVRLDTAHAHILLSDPATSDQGLAVLARAAESSDRHGLAHQRRSIDSIRRAFEQVH